MGERARQYFEDAERSGGIVGKMRLASLAGITSTEAARTEDTAELLGRLADAAQKLGTPKASRNEASGQHETEGVVAQLSANTVEGRVLRRHISACVELLTQRGLFLRTDEALKRITEATVQAIDVERVSIWMLEGGGRRIRCADLYERKPRRHSSGIELHQKDYAPYFAALSKERTIAAHDAKTDPRTSCFRTSYLEPLGIGALLDVPIWQNGQMVGVVCHEHLGGPRTWNSDEETFAYLVANFVALAMERART